MQLQQFNNNGCLSYILVDRATKQAVLIDPSTNTNEYDEFLEKDNSKLLFVIDTHTHADHVSGAEISAKKYRAKIVMASKREEQQKVDPTIVQDETVLHTLLSNYKIDVDQLLEDDQELQIGATTIKAIHTPGHTKDSMSLLVNNSILFTGDHLLIGQVGRTDLPGSNAEQMYKSFKERILPLPESITIYPGHDYDNTIKTTLQKNINTTLKAEKLSNPFLQQQRMIDFVKLAKKTTYEIKPGMSCGTGKIHIDPQPAVNEAITSTTLAHSAAAIPSLLMKSKAEASFYEQMFKIILQKFTMNPPQENVMTADQLVEELQNTQNTTDIFLLDVRNPEELLQYGQIGDAVNIPLPQLVNRLPELPENNDIKIVVYCQSGMRSAIAAYFLKEAFSYKSVRTLDGGFNGFVHAM